jgi:hypothetical protein
MCKLAYLAQRISRLDGTFNRHSERISNSDLLEDLNGYKASGLSGDCSIRCERKFPLGQGSAYPKPSLKTRRLCGFSHHSLTHRPENAPRLPIERKHFMTKVVENGTGWFTF